MDQPVLEYARLEGELVFLRPLRVADVDAAFPLVHARPAVTDQLIWDGPETREELVPWYASWVVRSSQGANYHLAIVEREGEAFCGSISARFRGHPFQADVGYWLGEDFWGRGYMTEAVALVAHLCFEHLRSTLCYAHVFIGNKASVRVLEKCGYVEDERGSDEVEKQGEQRRRRFFSLGRRSWSERREEYAPVAEDVRLRASAP